MIFFGTNGLRIPRIPLPSKDHWLPLHKDQGILHTTKSRCWSPLSKAYYICYMHHTNSNVWFHKLSITPTEMKGFLAGTPPPPNQPLQRFQFGFILFFDCFGNPPPHWTFHWPSLGKGGVFTGLNNIKNNKNIPKPPLSLSFAEYTSHFPWGKGWVVSNMHATYKDHCCICHV